MKKSIIVLVTIFLVMIIFSSCDTWYFRNKELIVDNQSNLDITELNVNILDSGQLTNFYKSAGESMPTVYITSGESKEYAIPYIPSNSRSDQIYVFAEGMDSLDDDYDAGIVFTFDTSSSEGIILTLTQDDERGASISYHFEGEGAGFQKIDDLD
ncbi:MAG: hypothetical protein PQJ47_04965 [Sphaerochaetaceae bacterium]|nr:hypothetical protein [Sphaerochaetaceae bacterium]MDC7247466.1 hypothetical protein [Sphaerochaetaceae bacterium]